MRYSEDPARSAELLRLALPQIARNGGRYTPTAFAVWYEHLSGANEPLSTALSTRIQEAGEVDHEAIETLHGEHIRSRELAQSEALQRTLQDLSHKLVSAVTTSSGSASEFARTLSEGERALSAADGPAELADVIRKLLESTHKARESTDSLRQELESSQTEMQTLRQKMETLESQTLTDPLTGLRNRRGLEQVVAKMRDNGDSILEGAALLVVDIDHFKRVNDNYGHLFGDQAIKALAKVFISLIKGRDIAVRWGGEEFVVLLPNTPMSGAFTLAEQIRDAFGRTRIRRAGSEKVLERLSVSVGIATPRSGETLEQALDRADKALYRAKNEGRNCTRMAKDS